MKTTLLMVENIGLKPCKCIGKESPVAEQEKTNTSIVKHSAEQKKYVTAFVDESIRVNPWRAMDESIPEKQGLYSYIICEGIVTSEKMITEKNTLYTDVESTAEVHSTGEIAMEAIMAVLFRLVAIGYQDNVLIYTDNMNAKDCWYKSAASKHLSKLFTGVTVCYIPREANSKADKLGRERAVMDLPAETMVRILGRCKGYFALKEEMNFVKSYFPVPMKNIPNLMMELKALVGAGEGGN